MPAPFAGADSEPALCPWPGRARPMRRDRVERPVGVLGPMLRRHEPDSPRTRALLGPVDDRCGIHEHSPKLGCMSARPALVPCALRNRVFRGSQAIADGLLTPDRLRSRAYVRLRGSVRDRTRGATQGLPGSAVADGSVRSITDAREIAMETRLAAGGSCAAVPSTQGLTRSQPASSGFSASSRLR